MCTIKNVTDKKMKLAFGKINLLPNGNKLIFIKRSVWDNDSINDNYEITLIKKVKPGAEWKLNVAEQIAFNGYSSLQEDKNKELFDRIKSEINNKL